MRARLEAVVGGERLDQARVLEVVQVEAHQRRQPRALVHLRLVALVHDTLRLDRRRQVDLEEAEALALVADRSRVEAGTPHHHLAVLPVGAAGRGEERLCALVQPFGSGLDPLQPRQGAVKKPGGDDATGRLGKQLESYIILELPVVGE